MGEALLDGNNTAGGLSVPLAANRTVFSICNNFSSYRVQCNFSGCFQLHIFHFESFRPIIDSTLSWFLHSTPTFSTKCTWPETAAMSKAFRESNKSKKVVWSIISETLYMGLCKSTKALTSRILAAGSTGLFQHHTRTLTLWCTHIDTLVRLWMELGLEYLGII